MYSALFTGALFASCDSSTSTQLNQEKAGYKSTAELRTEAISIEKPKELDQTGKIYTKGDYILVNEQFKGIHVINNTNPSDPKTVAFVNIPGNVDVVMKDDVLFADNYADMVTINVNTGEINRVENAFSKYKNNDGQFVAFNGDQPKDMYGMGVGFRAVGHSGPSGGGNSGPGVGGSMSRFAVVGDYMYAIDGDELKVFDIKRLYKPELVKTVAINFEVETIYPYGDKLFIGGTQGMYVYDNADPTNPELLSQFEHAVACDPVVADGTHAYVTLRNGTPCGGAANELLVVDIEDVTKPKLVKAYEMFNPHGLAVEQGLLYLCDGKQGLKVYDIYDKSNVTGNLIFKDHDVSTFDVIPTEKSLIVVGKDGLVQYDRTNAADMKVLSTIKVKNS